MDNFIYHSFETDYLFGTDSDVVKNKLDNLVVYDGTFTILLSHRPELFSTYASYPVNLALSGHAHGGQFQLLKDVGLVAPNQGLFPKYDSGEFNSDNTTMIVSRGIGNSIIPIRLNNRPEIVTVTLNCPISR